MRGRADRRARGNRLPRREVVGSCSVSSQSDSPELIKCCMGLRHDPTYRSWNTMLWRCRAVPRYRDRGISVCNRWLVFKNFVEDMGPRPLGTTIERINNSGNYEPDNCRWATTKEQARNKRNNRFVTMNGQTLCISDWARLAGISAPLMRYRLLAGWPADRLFSHPK